MMPFPEPAGDIRAQLAAVMDPQHPKRAAFIAPENTIGMPFYADAQLAARPEGVLVTQDEALADAFRCAPSETDAFDRTMADILDLPEAKPDVVKACGGRPAANSRAVQARDSDGYVVTETFASPAGLAIAREVMRRHVPPGGELVELSAIEAIGRRVLLREAEQ